jgi:hypothetical protein
VNFLLHHHLAWRDLQSAAAALGAMLPDVWRMADRRARLRQAPPTVETGALRAVLAGIDHHVAIDARFHRAPVFTDGEQAVREALRKASDAPKLGLFAHVAWELCLDGALVRRAGLPPLLRALSGSLTSVRPDAHHRAARSRAPTVSDPERFDARVDRILDAIALGPWISGYATGEGIAERIDGVRARFGILGLTVADRRAVAAALEALAPRADDALGAILTW